MIPTLSISRRGVLGGAAAALIAWRVHAAGRKASKLGILPFGPEGPHVDQKDYG